MGVLCEPDIVINKDFSLILTFLEILHSAYLEVILLSASADKPAVLAKRWPYGCWYAFRSHIFPKSQG